MASAAIEYRLHALDEFVCIGADCPANCCCDTWKIQVEPEIRERWQALADTAERDRLLAAVSETTENGEKTLRITRSESGCCPLLTPDSQCSLQQKHGEALMPTICRTYPRFASGSRIHSLSTASLSCPEIARLVLFAPSGRAVFRKSTPGINVPLDDQDRIRSTLTRLLDQVMTESRFSVATRVYYLADIITRMSRLSMQGQLSAATLDRAAADCKTDLYQISVAIKERRLRADPAVAGSYWHTLFRIGRNLQLLPEQDPSSPLATVLPPALPERLNCYDAAHAEVTRLRNAARETLQPFESHFNRYLHATLMYHGFPWNPAVDNYIASLMHALVPFTLARLHLWLLASQRGAITDSDVLETTYRIERRISHSRQVLTILNANPELLELDRYHTTFVDL